MSVCISWCFLGYFLILFAERVQSLVRTFRQSPAGAFDSGFDIYVNGVALLSLTAALVLLLGFNRSFWPSLGSTGVLPDYTRLTVTAGVLLVSGMVHTEYTAAPVQFIAYGCLIAAMVLQTAVPSAGSAPAFMRWYSMVFLTVFSMAIPVMYRSGLPYARLFHGIEAVVSLALVVCFTVMLHRLFTGNGGDLLLWVPLLIAVLGDAILVILRWKESVNTFLLIFVSLTAVMFVAGRILFSRIG